MKFNVIVYSFAFILCTNQIQPAINSPNWSGVEGICIIHYEEPGRCRKSFFVFDLFSNSLNCSNSRLTYEDAI